MRTGVLLATGAGLVALGVADAAYRTRNWGASDGEVRASLPGDDLVPEPADNNTMVVGVAAPAVDVWAALLQRLTAAAGVGELEVGTAVPAAALGAVGTCRVTRIDPGRAVVLGHGSDVVRSLHVVPLGPRRCRLLARTRAARTAVVARALDPVLVVGTRRMLLAVASAAERAAARTAVSVR